MKKLVVYALIAAMTFGTLAGCGNEVKTSEGAKSAVAGTSATEEDVVTEEETEQEIIGGTSMKTGGWTVNEEFTDVLTDEEKEAFEKAMEGLMGVSYTPIAVLAKQVVAGQNLLYLCQGTTVTANPVSGFYTVSVYLDLQGNATLNGIFDWDLEAVTDLPESTGEAAEALSGGWYVNQDLNAAVLPEDAEGAFEEATGALLGVGYEPVALLGTQVVNGLNYLVLAKATTVTAEPVTSLKFMTIWQCSDGSVTLTKTADFVPADYLPVME